MSLPILSLVTFVPLLGALAILAMPRAQSARWIALGTTIIVFALSLVMWAGFDNANPGFQMVEKANWLGGGISYHMGVDGISMLFVVLTAGLMPFCIAASWESVETRVAEYMIAFLVLETMMIGVFCALDLVLFYVLFEAGLIPMFLIIGILTAKLAKKASHSHICICGGKCGEASSATMSVVPVYQYMLMIASSISTEPMKV